MLIVALPDFLRPFTMKMDTLAYVIGGYYSRPTMTETNIPFDM